MANPVHLNPSGQTGLPADVLSKSQAGAPPVANGPSFSEALDQAQNLRFSNHAQKRLQSRHIQLTDDGLARLTDAVDKAGQRGGRESLVLMDDLAFIVNVPERLVVTAVDAQNRGEGVFTQIDSVVIAQKYKEQEV